MVKKSSITIGVLLVLLILIIVNALSSKLFFRLDFTGDKRYTLSKSNQKRT